MQKTVYIKGFICYRPIKEIESHKQCIKRWKENLKTATEQKWIDWWTYLINSSIELIKDIENQLN